MRQSSKNRTIQTTENEEFVDLLINNSLSLSLSRSAVIKPGRDDGDEFRVHVEYV